MLLRIRAAPLLKFQRKQGGASGGLQAPSIFSAHGFGRKVATHFLAGADLHGHRPAVLTRARLSRLCTSSAAPYPRARFTPPRACCLPARAHTARCCARVRSSRPPSSALPRATQAGRLSCGTFRREPATRGFDWSFAATPTSRDRFARQAPSELLPGLPPASLAAGVVHLLSGRCARAETLAGKTRPPRSVVQTFRSRARSAPWSEFQDGPRTGPGRTRFAPAVSRLFTPLPRVFSPFPRGTSSLSVCARI